VTASQRRQAVRPLQETFGVSQRRTCRLLRQPRSTQRQRPKTSAEEERLVRRVLELVRHHPRYGYRRIGVLLRREGWRVNRKRVYRLWRQQGLNAPRKQRKKRRLGHSGNSCVRRLAQHKDHVWSWDFVHDRTRDSRPLKWFTLVDEYTRECLALEVERRMTAQTVRTVLAAVVEARGAPTHIRSDNGSEFIAQAIRAWMKAAGLETLYIAPGAPWENGYAESLGSKVRDELFNAEEFGSVMEAKVLAKEWRQQYNPVRPHSSLGYRTPAEFGKTCLRPDSAALRRAEDTSVTVDTTLTAPGT
jgi:putative transposase